MINDLSPVSIDAIIPQGSDVYEILTIYTDEEQTLPLDLTGFVAKYQVRKTFDSAIKLLDLSNTTGELIMGATELTPYLSSDLTNGTIAIKYEAASTTAIRFKGDSLDCYRSMELTDENDQTRRVLDGTITFTREIVT
jgi:hypothetical protein